jgi:hypothetical protein
MFAKTIIDSDAFIDMPLSTQALYFHLSMRADDDGFINNARKIQRMIGASDDDMKVLWTKRFIIPFESGIVVIKHWKIHNYIRGDRKKTTVYPEEMAMLEEKENGAYTLKSDMTDKCLSSDGQVTVKCQHRLGEDRIDKDKLVEGSVGEDTSPLPSLQQIKDYVTEHNLNVDPNRFFSYYSKSNWKTTKGNPVDWQDKLQEWNNTEKKEDKPPKGSNPFLNALKNGDV